MHGYSVIWYKVSQSTEVTDYEDGSLMGGFFLTMEMNYSQNANCIIILMWVWGLEYILVTSKPSIRNDYVLYYQDIYHFCYISVLKFSFSERKTLIQPTS